jgi:DNA polymerase-3 subunit delta'
MNGWQQIVGHDWAVELLSGAIRHGRVGHAYLVTGPAQVGKTTLARVFAQALNCTAPEPDSRPCGTCRSCQLVAKDRHPDVRLESGELSGRGKRTLKIDQIRELQRSLTLTAAEGRYKVAIVRDFESANANAANAFLKTLEEPPPRVVIVLTASEADALLPTIASRCQAITLRPLTYAIVERALQERWRVPADKARLLAHLAEGRLGWAVACAEKPQLLADRANRLDKLEQALPLSRVDRFGLAEQLTRTPEELPDLLRVWLGWWRDLLLLANGNGGAGAITNVDHEERLRTLAQEWPRDAILRCLKATEEELTHLERNANARLALEVLLLGYPRTSPVPAARPISAP